MEEASKYHAELVYADLNSPDVQVIAVSDSHCYKNAVLQRTMALIKHKDSPVVVDLFRVLKNEKSTYDLPVYFQGQIITTNFKSDIGITNIDVLGVENGYQHLWNLGKASDLNGMSSVTWMNGVRFYTYSFVADKNSELFFTKIGANDPI